MSRQPTSLLAGLPDELPLTATVLTFLTCCGQLWMYIGMRQPGRVSLRSQIRTLGRLFAFGSFAMLIALVASAFLLVVIAKAKLRVSSLRETYGNIYLEWGNLVSLSLLAHLESWLNQPSPLSGLVDSLRKHYSLCQPRHPLCAAPITCPNGARK